MRFAGSPYGHFVTQDAGSSALPERYALWQERLAKEFFAGRQSQPVVMFISRGELDELVTPGEDGARLLASAVREVIDVSAGKVMFARAERLQAVWQRGTRTEPPPTLPILALSVLAASEMRSDGEGARHNYYIRLARALVPDAADVEIAAIRHTLREQGAFVAVASMWERVDAWLTSMGGTFGYSTIRGDPEQTRIGYPLSQTLVRRSDRAALTGFFARLDLKADGVPSGESLLKLLRVWIGHRHHSFSERFVQSLGDREDLRYMAPLVHQLAVAWDGKIITADGLRHLDIRLAVDIDVGKSWWVIPAARDLPADTLHLPSGGDAVEAVITTDPHSSVYAAAGLPPVSPAALSSGLTLRGSRCVAEFSPSSLLVMVDSADAGGWVSADALHPYEPHVFVVSAGSMQAVERALGTAADAGWRKLPQQLASALIGSGWVIYDRVAFSDEQALSKALLALPRTVAATVHLGETARPRLINGLPLLRGIGRNVYLAGGEPDLLLPVGDGQRDVTVTLDGVEDRLRASIFPFPLRRLGGGHAEGAHTVEADGEVLTFVVAPASADDRAPSGADSLVGSTARSAPQAEAMPSSAGWPARCRTGLYSRGVALQRAGSFTATGS